MCTMYIENFLTIQLVKEFENRSTFANVIIKHQGAYFWGTECTGCLKKARPLLHFRVTPTGLIQCQKFVVHDM